MMDVPSCLDNSFSGYNKLYICLSPRWAYVSAFDIDGLVQDCSISIALQWRYCSLALSHWYHPLKVKWCGTALTYPDYSWLNMEWFNQAWTTVYQWIIAREKHMFSFVSFPMNVILPSPLSLIWRAHYHQAQQTCIFMADDIFNAFPWRKMLASYSWILWR